MRRRALGILVTLLLLLALSVGLSRPAQAAPAPVRSNAAVACLWIPLLNLGFC